MFEIVILKRSYSKRAQVRYIGPIGVVRIMRNYDGDFAAALNHAIHFSDTLERLPDMLQCMSCMDLIDGGVLERQGVQIAQNVCSGASFDIDAEPSRNFMKGAAYIEPSRRWDSNFRSV